MRNEPAVRTAQATDPNLRTAYVFSWSLGVQQVLTKTLTLDVGYVGNHATKLLGLQYTNTPFYGAGYCIGYSAAQITQVQQLGGVCPTTITAATNSNATAAQVGRPLNGQYPYLSYVYTVQNLYDSNYNGLQTSLDGTSVERPELHHRLHSMRTDWINPPANAPARREHLSISGTITATATTTSAIALPGTVTYALPGKKGYGGMLSGWKLTSIVTMQTALPWGIAGSRGGANDPSGTQEFADTWNFSGKSQRL